MSTFARLNFALTIISKRSTLKYMDGAQQSISINLGKKKKPSVSNAFYVWAINGGKVLIILTELVALGALSYRFYIDRRIIDLHDEIKKQELFLSRTARDEATYRNLQDRLAYVKATTDESEAKVALMNTVSSEINKGTFLSTNLTVSTNAIVLSGIALSVVQLNTFIETLKEQEKVSAISLDEVRRSDEGINFKLTIVLETTEDEKRTQ